VTRDRLMTCLGAAHPGYGFERHMGYSVPEHFAALDRLGPTDPSPPLVLAGGDRAWHIGVPRPPIAAPAYCLSRCRAVYGRRSDQTRIGDHFAFRRSVADRIARGPMFYVPLYIEGLRSRPLLVFWLATLAQAAVWIAGADDVLRGAAGRTGAGARHRPRIPLEGDVGPPLAYWLAEIAFRVAGLFGVYALSQICVIATYWCVFALGRAIVGATHAAWRCCSWSAFRVRGAVAEFRPADSGHGAVGGGAIVLLARRHGEGRRQYWYALGVAAALFLITTDAALILLGALSLFTAATERGRAAADAIEAWIVAARAHRSWCSCICSGLNAPATA
jgi:hypothetical protein